MRWMLAGCCGLALISLSVTQNVALEVTQIPRFYGIKTGHTVPIKCSVISDHQVTVEWYKSDKYDQPPEKRETVVGKTSEDQSKGKKQINTLFITKAKMGDNGMYFCKMNNTWGRGTKVTVIRSIDITKALHQSRMKDGLIIFQGLLLAVCIAATLIRKHTLSENSDSLYEEPETDHIYEGLAIETCSGGLYEELSIYAQAEGAEAPWEKD